MLKNTKTMSRQINSTQPFSDRLVKLIPTEIIGAYTALATILGFGPGEGTNDYSNQSLIMFVFFALLLLTPIYAWKINGIRYKLQLVLITISFVIWVYTLGGPFVKWNMYYPNVSVVILILWSLIPPLFVSQVVPEKSVVSSVT